MLSIEVGFMNLGIILQLLLRAVSTCFVWAELCEIVCIHQTFGVFRKRWIVGVDILKNRRQYSEYIHEA